MALGGQGSGLASHHNDDLESEFAGLAYATPQGVLELAISIFGDQLMVLDRITRELTNSASFHELILADGVPRLNPGRSSRPQNRIDAQQLADAYDVIQVRRDDCRRAFRGNAQRIQGQLLTPSQLALLAYLKSLARCFRDVVVGQAHPNHPRKGLVLQIGKGPHPETRETAFKPVVVIGLAAAGLLEPADAPFGCVAGWKLSTKAVQP